MPDPDWGRDIRERGEAVAPSTGEDGCRFRARCPEAGGLCETAEPLLKTVETDRYVACHYTTTPGRI
jgi:ABC-type dipeptide/oligopeptide/nickel transport system ATPase component